jgi:hypothetical protein
MAHFAANYPNSGAVLPHPKIFSMPREQDGKWHLKAFSFRAFPNARAAVPVSRRSLVLSKFHIGEFL